MIRLLLAIAYGLHPYHLIYRKTALRAARELDRWHLL